VDVSIQIFYDYPVRTPIFSLKFRQQPLSGLSFYGEFIFILYFSKKYKQIFFFFKKKKKKFFFFLKKKKKKISLV